MTTGKTRRAILLSSLLLLISGKRPPWRCSQHYAFLLCFCSCIVSRRPRPIRAETLLFYFPSNSNNPISVIISKRIVIVETKLQIFICRDNNGGGPSAYPNNLSFALLVILVLLAMIIDDCFIYSDLLHNTLFPLSFPLRHICNIVSDPSDDNCLIRHRRRRGGSTLPLPPLQHTFAMSLYLVIVRHSPLPHHLICALSPLLVYSCVQ